MVVRVRAIEAGDLKIVTFRLSPQYWVMRLRGNDGFFGFCSIFRVSTLSFLRCKVWGFKCWQVRSVGRHQFSSQLIIRTCVHGNATSSSFYFSGNKRRRRILFFLLSSSSLHDKNTGGKKNTALKNLEEKYFFLATRVRTSFSRKKVRRNKEITFSFPEGFFFPQKEAKQKGVRKNM